jgi:hypothetical protein
MITQQQLDEQGERVKALGDQIQALAVVFHEESDKLKKMINTWKIQTWVYGEDAKFVMNTLAPLQASVLTVLSSPTETAITAPSSDLGRVRVDWSGRGMSSGSYKVVADKGKFLEIAFELDVERKMTVSKSRTAAA